MLVIDLINGKVSQLIPHSEVLLLSIFFDLLSSHESDSVAIVLVLGDQVHSIQSLKWRRWVNCQHKVVKHSLRFRSFEYNVYINLSDNIHGCSTYLIYIVPVVQAC